MTPGAVVLVKSRYYQGNVQPWVLVSEIPTGWMAVRLTKEPRYTNGDARIEIRNPTAIGLRPGRSFLWSPEPRMLSRLDIIEVIGKASDDLMSKVAK